MEPITGRGALADDQSLLDPLLLRTADELIGAKLDPRRTICLAEFDDDRAVAALAGYANTAGGWLLLGAAGDDAGTAVRSVAGMSDDAPRWFSAMAAHIDPPVDALLQIRRLPAGDGRFLYIVAVRQSPRPPHLDTCTGIIYRNGEHGLEAVRARADLDALYAKGRAERDRAERLIEAMTERLMLAHYAYFGLGIVACLQQPTADAYLWAREHPDELATPDDPFMREWDFTGEAARVRPAEVELRGEREVCAIVRVARTGCVAIGETRRRPPGDMLGTPEELRQRLGLMVATACRVLAQARPSLIVPRLFCEGLKGMRLVTSRQPYAESGAAALDMVQEPGPTGDATDEAYRERLTGHFAQLLCEPFLHDGHDDSKAAG